MNDKLKDLFEKSGLTKKEFCEIIGIKEQRYRDILREGAYELKPKTFKKFSDNYKLVREFLAGYERENNQ